MKRKILLGLLVLVGLFMITGCGTNPKTEINGIEEQKKQSNLKIGNVSIDLNRSASFHDISYKYPENATSGNMGTFAIMDLMDGEKLAVRIAMYFYENKEMGAINAGAGLSSVDVIRYNNNTWNVYKGVKDGKQVMNYATQEGDNSYTITFLSDYDIEEFSDVFMKTVIINR